MARPTLPEASRKTKAIFTRAEPDYKSLVNKVRKLEGKSKSESDFVRVALDEKISRLARRNTRIASLLARHNRQLKKAATSQGGAILGMS